MSEGNGYLSDIVRIAVSVNCKKVFIGLICDARNNVIFRMRLFNFLYNPIHSTIGEWFSGSDFLMYDYDF